jgi:transcriptional regulator with XRE-family HTH domain
MATSRVPNLRKLRTERLLSQPQLAEALGLSSRTILRWEAGDGEPAATELLALARFFSVSIDQLVSDLLPSESPTRKTKVSELSGEVLDYWVAKLQGQPVRMTGEGPRLLEDGKASQRVPAYGTDAALGEPLLQRKGVQIQSWHAGRKFDGIEHEVSGWVARCAEESAGCWGTTMLEAGLRAYLVSVAGHSVFE